MEWTTYQGVEFFSDAPEEFTHDRLIHSWIRLMKSESSTADYESNFWAFEIMDEMVRHNPGYAWSSILDILAADHDTKIMETLSAGPLEDLLVRHGEEYIAKVEEQARADPLFAKLLGGVWQNAMSEEVWQRIQRVRDRSGWDGIPE